MLPRRIRRAFTLVELLAVIAVIALLATLLAGLRPGSPKGLDGATQQAQSMFQLARSQAMLANNLDPDYPDDRLYTPRARVIILNDQTDTENHLSRMGVILGGQLVDPKTGRNRYTGGEIKGEKDLQESDLVWYAVGEGATLPKGFYYVDNANKAVTKAILKSDVENKTFPSTPTMRVEFPRRKAQRTGSGKTWYFYEFLSSGAANMSDKADVTGARFIVMEGEINPATKELTAIAGKENIVGGLLILRPGTTVSINKKYEAK